MFKIYKVYVSEHEQDKWEGNWWDEYFGHVVIAENKNEALELALKKGMMVPKEKVTIEEILPNEKGIIMSDFNAG